MASMAYDTIPVRDGGFTVEDLDEMPEDGRRYELVDGVLIVSPSPFPRHQVAGLTLYRLLVEACPLDRIVLAAPTDRAPWPAHLALSRTYSWSAGKGFTYDTGVLLVLSATIAEYGSSTRSFWCRDESDRPGAVLAQAWARSVNRGGRSPGGASCAGVTRPMPAGPVRPRASGTSDIVDAVWWSARSIGVTCARRAIQGPRDGSLPVLGGTCDVFVV